MNDHPVNTIPNHQPTKMVVLPKTFVQNILDAKSLVLCIQVYFPQITATTFAFFSVFILLF